MKKWLSVWSLLGGLFGLAMNAAWVKGESPPPSPTNPNVSCLRIEIEGIIAAGTQKYLERALEAAQKRTTCLFIQLNTPGGHLDATRNMVQKLLNADIPVIVWVGPSGAHAGSAGVFITAAAHHAYMAEGTNIGAAHPIAGSGKDVEGEVGKKILNDTKAFALAIGEKRGRNKTWLVSSVEESVSVTASEAFKLGVINGLASSPEDVVRQVWPGKTVTFEGLEPSLSERFADFLANPNIAYMLLGFGALGIYIEISHPGLIFPGLTGVVCLLLSFISMNFIPINYGAVALTLLGIVLLVVELFVPSFGVLGVTGIVSFLLGSLFFVDGSSGLKVSLGMILPVTIVIVGMVLWIGQSLTRLRKMRPSHGVESMRGQLITVETWAPEGRGRGLFQGDLWNLRSKNCKTYQPGDRVKIDEVEGLTLIVE